MRPKSEIYTPKRDDEHPRPFHMRVFPPAPGPFKWKLTEQYFPGVLFIVLCKVVLTFESVDETLKSDHSNELSSIFPSFPMWNKQYLVFAKIILTYSKRQLETPRPWIEHVFRRDVLHPEIRGK